MALVVTILHYHGRATSSIVADRVRFIECGWPDAGWGTVDPQGLDTGWGGAQMRTFVIYAQGRGEGVPAGRGELSMLSQEPARPRVAAATSGSESLAPHVDSESDGTGQ